MTWRAALAALALLGAAPAPDTAPDEQAEAAVAEALTLPPGYPRDAVLRAISRNLRWSGHPDVGIRAARAMTDGGKDEIPPGTVPAPPRYVPLRTAFPDARCDTAPDAAIDDWARACLLERDFHWIGLPDAALVRGVASRLRDTGVRRGVLAMLVHGYGDADDLRFVAAEQARRPDPAVAALLATPQARYRLGERAAALTAARATRTFDDKAAAIRLMLAAGDVDAAMAVFDTMADTPPRLSDDCFGWFGPIGGLALGGLGNVGNPVPAVGTFIDRASATPLFRRLCPAGLDAETAVALSLTAGRADDALARARQETATPFLLVDTVLQIARQRLRAGDRATAQRLLNQAAAALPPYRADERGGDTGRRVHLVQLLAAAGASDAADTLARRQPAGALRAVALSAAVAGRAGLRFDDQAPMLETIDPVWLPQLTTALTSSTAAPR